MTSIRTYLSTFLLAICMFSVMLNKVHAVEIKPTKSSENRYSFVSIVAVILNSPYHYFKRFFSSSVIIKPNVKQEVILQESLNLLSNPSVTESVTVPLSDTTETVDLEQVSSIKQLAVDELETQSIKVMNNHDQPLQISLSSFDENDCTLQESLELISKLNEMESVAVPLSDTTETVKLEQVTSNNLLVVDELGTQNIKILNNHDQSLQISLSSLDEDDYVLHQFSVPSYSYGSINLN